MPAQLPLGALRLVAIEDGHFSPPAAYMFPKWDQSVIDAEAAGVTSEGSLHIPIGCYLVDGPAGPILIDSGGGPNELTPEPFTTGALPSELAKLGLDPGDIVAVIHSHLHFDHWGGDVDAQGEPAFPNAMLILSNAELEWGRNQNQVAARFLPLVDAGRVQQVEGGDELFPGIRAVPSPGHTPGHLCVALDGGAEQALVIGDVAHHPAQLDHPDWGVRFDDDPDRADATRAAVFDRIVARDEILVGGHWPAPGWGRVLTSDDRRRFEAI